MNRAGHAPVHSVMMNRTLTTVNSSRSPHRRITRTRAGLAAGVVALALVAGACSSGSKVSTGGNGKTTTTASTGTTKKSGGGGGVGF